MKISPLESSQSNRIAQLHLDSLTTQFSGRAGLSLLSCYYKTLATSKGGCGYVAVEGGEVVGYVCGIWESKIVRMDLLRRFFFPLISWALIGILKNRGITKSLFSRYIRRSQGNHDDDAGYELRPIVVAPKARGTGLAGQLVKRLVEDAGERGFYEVILYAEEDNLAANAFYSKYGFCLEKSTNVNGKVYFKYSYKTTN